MYVDLANLNLANLSLANLRLAGAAARLMGLSKLWSNFESDYYSLDGGTGKVSAFLEKVPTGRGIRVGTPTHAMSQSTSALQCAVPAASALFQGRVAATFVDQRYSSTAPASAWAFLHSGEGATVYDVFSLDTVSGAHVRLSTSYGSVQRGWNVSCSAATLVSFMANGTATISVIQSASILATGTAYYSRARYSESASPEHDIYLKTTLGASGATTAAPSASDPIGTLMLGNRVTTLDQPFVGKWLCTIILKGAYSAADDAIVREYLAAKYGVI